MKFDRKILLDTCALLWLAGDQTKLSDDALDRIQNASLAIVSAISAWEIGLKYVRNQLKLPMEPQSWFKTALEKHSLLLYPLDTEILFEANRLPWHHKDPADRFILATAIREDATVVTSDGNFENYGVDIIC